MKTRDRDDTRFRSACRTTPVTKPCAAPAWWPERCAQDPIPSRTRPSNAPAPMVLCLKTRESRSPPGLPSTRRHTNPIPSTQADPTDKTVPHLGAGWSSPVARQAHNLKVAGSNPAPATNTHTTHKKPITPSPVPPHGAFCRSQTQHHPTDAETTLPPVGYDVKRGRGGGRALPAARSMRAVGWSYAPLKGRCARTPGTESRFITGESTMCGDLTGILDRANWEATAWR